MKTFLVLASVMGILFLTAPNKIEAQKRKPSKILEGTITGYECGDNCYLTITDKRGKEHTGLCAARPLCTKWNAEAMMPESYKGRSVKVTIAKGMLLTGGGDVAGTMDAFTTLQLTGSESIGSQLAYSQASENAIIDRHISREAKRSNCGAPKEYRTTLRGDVNGDGTADTVVLYTLEECDGAINWAQSLAVFLRKGRSIQFAAVYNGAGGKSIRAVELKSISGGKINLDTMTYRSNDPACCPSRKGKTKYVFSKGKLREVK